MGVPKLPILLLAILFIQGCSPSQPPDPPAKTVFDPLSQPINKARGVQQAVDQNAEGTQKAIESQQRGESSQ
jgi:hypothetical protein